MSYQSNIMIISGGQTGADQGALEGASMAGFRTGGYIPKGFKTERGSMPGLARFGLIESPSTDYVYRTQLNVKASSMTLWFGSSDSTGFYATSKACKLYNKPFYNVSNYTADDIMKLIISSNPTIINVAGNRESRGVGIQERVKNIMFAVLSKLKVIDNSPNVTIRNIHIHDKSPTLDDFNSSDDNSLIKIQPEDIKYLRKKKIVKPKPKRKLVKRCKCK